MLILTSTGPNELNTGRSSISGNNIGPSELNFLFKTTLMDSDYTTNMTRKLSFFLRILLTSVFKTLFKKEISQMYLFKKLNISISNALDTEIFIKYYYFKPLKNTLKTDTS